MMLSKAFRPLVIKKPVPDADSLTATDFPLPPTKRRKIEEDEDGPSHRRTSQDAGKSLLPPKGHSGFRKPLAVVQNSSSPEALPHDGKISGGREGYFLVLWRKFTAKKHKIWDGDGILIVREGCARLQDVSGTSLGAVPVKADLEVGSTLTVGGKEIEIDCEISKEDYLARRPSSKPKTAKKVSTEVPMTNKSGFISGAGPTLQKPKMGLQAQLKAAVEKKEDNAKKLQSGPSGFTGASQTAFKNPLRQSTYNPQTPSEMPVPRYDPDAADALVFRRPLRAPKDRQIVDVVLDPVIGKNLREHQREGVQFLYECVMGLRDFNGEGCILADEMGLGKTLQSIALLWTLLKQNPVYRAEPVIKKALIVCPVTLIGNWRREIRKWLGDQRIGVYVADGTRTRLTDFTMGATYQVMIIGYERLRSVAEDLTKGGGIDIVIADEGHRLKTEKNKCAKAIQTLQCSKRIILSGTPIQNDLSEFFVMANFVNDGCLGTYKSFVKNIETPLLKSRQPDASQEDLEVGEARGEELARITSPFILRRTAEILSKYLPPKTEYVLFCTPTPEQANIYRLVLASPMFQSALGNAETALQLITILKKLCNSPALLMPKTKADKDSESSTSLATLLDMLPPHMTRTFRLGNQVSTKVRVLDQLLYRVRTHTDEKVVVVSNYTSTLDLISTLLTSTATPFLRLDGTTSTSKRTQLVDEFNRSKSTHCFAFLLSAKAGGMGLNLIGASRLILFDVDWNPAVEEQAMARIHRQGQKKKCRIYRFVIKGGLEERIWQRQVVKRGLADSIVTSNSNNTLTSATTTVGGAKKNVAAFSKEELKDLFRLDERADLKTHDLIGCDCTGTGRVEIDATGVIDGNSNNLMESEGDEVGCNVDRGGEHLRPSTEAPSTTSGGTVEPEASTTGGTFPGQARTQGQKELGLRALMEYTHIDISRINQHEGHESQDDNELLECDGLDEKIDDACLVDVLRKQEENSGGGGIAWVFCKTSSGGKACENDVEVHTEKVKVVSDFFNV